MGGRDAVVSLPSNHRGRYVTRQAKRDLISPGNTRFVSVCMCMHMCVWGGGGGGGARTIHESFLQCLAG